MGLHHAAKSCAGVPRFELYWDRPESQGPHNPDGTLAMYAHQLDLEICLPKLDLTHEGIGSALTGSANANAMERLLREDSTNMGPAPWRLGFLMQFFRHR